MTYGESDNDMMVSSYEGKEMTWHYEIVQVLQELGGEGSLDDIYKKIESRRAKLPRRWREIIRKTLISHDDTFYATRGYGKGYWGLRLK